jgi:tetratricopeptide (TPR) repeat protein
MNEQINRFLKLLEQYPDNELARFSLGKSYFDLGNYSEAKAQFEKALARKRDWMVVQILLGKCEQAMGNIPAARAAYEKGLQLAIDQKHDGPQAELEQLLADL